MRIGIVTEYYYPTLGGIQEHVHHFAVEALARDHQVTIITSNVRDQSDRNTEGVKELPVIRLGRSLPIFNNGSVARITIGSRLGGRLQEIFDREAFDIIHVHSPLTPTLPILSLTRSNTTTVGTVHTNFNGNAFLRIFRRKVQSYLRHLDGIIAVSETAGGALKPYFDINYRVIPNGVDIAQFNPGAPRLPEFDDDKINLLWVARMEPRNGLDRLIAAFAAASAVRQDLRLIVVGDGPLRATYEGMVPDHLKSAVHFLGYINTGRPEIYSTADMLCTPATISSFGITLLKGMAASIPIIASDIDGFRDVMTHEREGLLVDTADITAFSDAILRLANDRGLRRTFAERGRETALTYSWPRITEQVIAYYGELIERRKANKACPPA